MFSNVLRLVLFEIIMLQVGLISVLFPKEFIYSLIPFLAKSSENMIAEQCETFIFLLKKLFKILIPESTLLHGTE